MQVFEALLTVLVYLAPTENNYKSKENKIIWWKLSLIMISWACFILALITVFIKPELITSLWISPFS